MSISPGDYVKVYSYDIILVLPGIKPIDSTNFEIDEVPWSIDFIASISDHTFEVLEFHSNGRRVTVRTKPNRWVSGDRMTIPRCIVEKTAMPTSELAAWMRGQRK